MNGETELHSLQHNVHTPFDLLFLAGGYTGLSPLLWRLFKQRNWATEDQTEYLSSVLLVGQLDGIIGTSLSNLQSRLNELNPPTLHLSSNSES